VLRLRKQTASWLFHKPSTFGQAKVGKKHVNGVRLPGVSVARVNFGIAQKSQILRLTGFKTPLSCQSRESGVATATVLPLGQIGRSVVSNDRDRAFLCTRVFEEQLIFDSFGRGF